MKKEDDYSQKVEDLIKPSSINILRKKDKDIMLFNLRKIMEDLNTMELILADVKMSPEHLLRSTQFIANSRKRIRKIIWELTGSSIKEDIN